MLPRIILTAGGKLDHSNPNLRTQMECFVLTNLSGALGTTMSLLTPLRPQKKKLISVVILKILYNNRIPVSLLI